MSLVRVLACAVLVVPVVACDHVSLPLIQDDDNKPVGTTPTKGGASDIAVDRGVVPGIAGEPDIRIRLRDGTTVARLGVSIGDHVWAMASDLSGTRHPVELLAPVSVSLDSSGWVITDKAGRKSTFGRGDIDLAPQHDMLADAPGPGELPAAGKLAREASSAGLAPKVTVDGGKFGGKLRLIARLDISQRSFDIIESVGVEEYLKGVVTAEMWPNWPQTAFAVQAVCARSYALHQRNLSRTQGLSFDVESSVKDQAYKGATESFNAAKAVGDTEGVVLTWSGEVLRAYYSSCSGGRAASAKDTWPISRGYEYNLAGPLQASMRDEYGSASPYFRWQTARTRQELITRLKHWGKVNGHPVSGISALSGITVSGSNVVGRPTKFVVNGAPGQVYTMSAEQLRFACNQEAEGAPALTKETRVYSGDMECTIAGDVVTIKGRGFGHGVGMDQWAVKELADKGETWREIVMKFYPGAKLQRAY